MNEIQINHFLDGIEVDMSQSSMSQISQDSIFKATGIEISLSEGLTTLSQKKPSQTKPFPIKVLDLEITNLLDSLTIL